MATTHGRRGCDVIVCGLLDYLIRGVSWCGQLTLDDILIIEGADGRLKLMITRPPSIGVNAPVAERLSDLQTVWTGLEPFYLLDGKLPLFFEELKNDITRATKSDISSPWFPVYIHFHPAFLSSLSRANFICRVHQDYKSLNLVANENYDVVFDSKPPLDDPDWRLRAKDGILSKTVYYHRWRNLTMTEKEKDLADTHVNTMADLLEFYRHSVQHVNQNATISDVDENELFTANKFPIFLPHLIKMLLKRNLLAHELASACQITRHLNMIEEARLQLKLRVVTAEGAAGNRYLRNVNLG